MMAKIIILYFAANLLAFVAGRFIGDFCHVGSCGDTVADTGGENVPFSEA